MRVLVACESSGIVRSAFRAIGHDAISCDLLPADDGLKDCHYQGDVRDILEEKWDLMIAHPPCTYLSVSGLHWNKRRPDRQTDRHRKGFGLRAPAFRRADSANRFGKSDRVHLVTNQETKSDNSTVAFWS